VKAETENKPRLFEKTSNRLKRTGQLILLAVLVDIEFVIVEIVAGLDPISDFRLHPVLYSYIYLGTIIVFGIFGSLIGAREDILRAMAHTDALTGLFNLRYMWARIDEEFALAQRHGTPLSLVIIDLDNFKSVNDNYGHPVGDRFLEQMGLTIHSMMREGEIGARVGGEEFALLLPHTTAQEAMVVAERIRSAIGQEQVTVNEKKVSVTASAGVACTGNHKDSNAREIYQLADQALMLAKREGRDKVMVALSKGLVLQ
jgi:diguanylate cyclase (GGDEF)-like protein